MRARFHNDKLTLRHGFQFVHCEKRSADHLERLGLILAMGQTARKNRLLSQRFGQHFRTLTIWRKTAENKQLSIDPSRIYVKYSETPNWGWNGSNF